MAINNFIKESETIEKSNNTNNFREKIAKHTIKQENIDMIYDNKIICDCRVLSKTAWNMKPNEMILCNQLQKLSEKILKCFKENTRNKKLEFNHKLSSVLVNFNGNNLIMDTLKFSIMCILEEEGKMCIENLNSKLACECTEDINILCVAKLVLIENDLYALNYEYSNGDLNLFSSDIFSSMNIEDIDMEQLMKNNETVLESQVMQYMKNVKSISCCELFDAFQNEEFKHPGLLNKVIENLANKGFIDVCDDRVNYSS
ncbi:hypothetical protein EDEG_02730 [Edhazardia aedis USNM 41457]|uniref:Uncharacterized protein n=1 Tax=Edhazardia aedis (strain USNM 41457) TaxID=1003232 RepID=J9D516_EDHAE|nr:hypothetical protein EDEG_02730 [Edhazardia aedis USNM 41457]|eukprot:EJW02906.1 hypothetical protein EDEG_02730 [Edhazardia aedis USNM 41457]